MTGEQIFLVGVLVALILLLVAELLLLRDMGEMGKKIRGKR